MIAVDSSSMIAFFNNDEGEDVLQVQQCLDTGTLLLPPIVLIELLSAPFLPETIKNNIELLPILDITPMYWNRVGLMRATLIENKLKARIADAMVAQVCIDNDICLITRDKDFRHFNKYFGLKLYY